MIEKIGEQGNACRDFISLVKEQKRKMGNIVIAEVGLGVGTTTMEVLPLLSKDDKYYLFDFDHVVSELIKDIGEKNDTWKSIVVGVPNSSNLTYDSYSWNLLKMLLDMKEKRGDGIFDVVYLDGAHSYIHDGLATCLLKKMVKRGGYLVFDDLYWSYKTSPTLSKPNEMEKLKKCYTDEQLESHHIEMLMEAFLYDDDEFEQIFFTTNRKPGKATFKRNS